MSIVFLRRKEKEVTSASALLAGKGKIARRAVYRAEIFPATTEGHVKTQQLASSASVIRATAVGTAASSSARAATASVPRASPARIVKSTSMIVSHRLVPTELLASMESTPSSVSAFPALSDLDAKSL